MTKFAYLIVLLIALTACGGSSSDDFKDVTESEVDFSFINSTDLMMDFHIRRDDLFDDDDENKLFRSSYNVADNIPTASVSTTYDYEYKNINNAIHIGAIDSNSLHYNAKSKTTLSAGKKYWGIIWKDYNELQFDTFRQKRKEQANIYNVRIFSNVNAHVYTNGTNNIATTLEKGKVSDFMQINQCANSLIVDDTEIDLCSVNEGYSYLVVYNNHGETIITRE